MRPLTSIALALALTGCERTPTGHPPTPTQGTPPHAVAYSSAERIWIAECVRDGMRGDNTTNALKLCLKYANEMRAHAIFK